MIILYTLLIVLTTLFVAIRLVTFHPPRAGPVAVTSPEAAPTLKAGQTLKVLSWNVQFMAGKNNLFWFDLPDQSGPDARPSREDISATLNEVARVIREEKPDIIFLQEIADGHAATDGEDQLARLLTLLPREYVCHTSAFYVWSAFVPRRQVLGAVGIKLSILSKYKISHAVRHQLAQTPADWLTRQFSPRRAVLEAHLPVQGGADFVAFVTHLDPLAKGTDILTRQLGVVQNLMRAASLAGQPWAFGGDFNLLPPDSQAFARLNESQKRFYDSPSELSALMPRAQSVPSFAECSGPEFAQWLTHNPNDVGPTQLDKTIDYIFFADEIKIGAHSVRQHDTLKISDHLPVLAEIQLP